MLVQLRPKAHSAYRSLPLLGPILDEFTDWCRDRGYTLRSLLHQLDGVRRIALFFRQRGLRRLDKLSQEDFEAARTRLHGKDRMLGGTIRNLEGFLQQVHGLVRPSHRTKTRVEMEISRYA